MRNWARQPGFVKGRLKGLPIGKLLKIFAAQFAQHRLERRRIKLTVGEMAVEISGNGGGRCRWGAWGFRLRYQNLVMLLL